MDTNNLSNEQLETLIDGLIREYDSREGDKERCYMVWHGDDVRGQYSTICYDYDETDKEVLPTLDRYEVTQVLHNLKRHHDATIGINWDTIDTTINEVLSND